MKKSLSMLALAAALAGICAVAFAEITPEEAKSIAAKQVPKGSTFVKLENEFDKPSPYYEVDFYDSSKHIGYEIEVFQSDGRIRSFGMEAKALKGGRNIVLKPEDVKALVLKEFPDAKIKRLGLDNDDGLFEYEVKFRARGLFGEITYNAESGAVLEKELQYQY